MHTTKRALVTALVVGGLALTGCSKASSNGGGAPAGTGAGTGRSKAGAARTATPVELLGAAPTKTISAGTARTSLSTQSTSTRGTVEVVAQGEIDFRGPRATMAMSVAGMDAQAIFDRDVVYEKVAALSGIFGKPWVRIDVSKLVGKSGSALGSQGGSPTSPAQGLDFVYGMLGDAKEVGRAQLRGASVEHYRGTVDMRRAIARIPDPEARKFIQGLSSQFGSSKVPTDVWLDDQGRVRKISYSLHGLKGLGDSKVSVEYYDFGTPVHIALPAPSQVADFNLFG